LYQYIRDFNIYMTQRVRENAKGLILQDTFIFCVQNTLRKIYVHVAANSQWI